MALGGGGDIAADGGGVDHPGDQPGDTWVSPDIRTSLHIATCHVLQEAGFRAETDGGLTDNGTYIYKDDPDHEIIFVDVILDPPLLILTPSNDHPLVIHHMNGKGESLGSGTHAHWERVLCRKFDICDPRWDENLIACLRDDYGMFPS